MLRFSSRTVHCWWWLLLSTSFVGGFNVLDNRCVSMKSILACLSFTIFPRCLTNLSEKSMNLIFFFSPSHPSLFASWLSFLLLSSSSCFLTNLLFPLFLCYPTLSPRCPPQTPLGFSLSSSHSPLPCLLSSVSPSAVGGENWMRVKEPSRTPIRDF